MSKRTQVMGEWAGAIRPIVLEDSGGSKNDLYVGVKETYTRVDIDVFLTELASHLGKRITVSDVKVETITTIENEVVYGA